MVCNVCGEESRCFVLTESNFPPGRPMGMQFCICPICLGKLVDTIKTDKTVIENPDEFPVPPGMARRMERMQERRERRNG